MTETETTKVCPFCAETIQAAAVVCRYCGRDLAPPAPPQPHVIQQGNTWKCSACGGFVRADATQCKHCKVALVGTPVVGGTTVTPTRRASPIAYIVVTLLLLGVLAWEFGFFGGSTTPRGVVPSTRPNGHQVTYRIGGKATQADLTYNNAQGGTEQKKVPIPWSTSFTASSGAFLYISAQNTGQSGSVACEILVDNVVVKSSTSEGAYKIASCSGRL